MSKTSKILLTLLIGLLVVIPVSVKASGGYLDKETIITCNGKQYGKHGDDGHWHQATADGKAKGANLGTDWTCQEDAQKVSVTLSKCVDGDTAKFILNGQEITTRFLAVDTPETKHPTKGVQPFGPEASEYTCKSLTEANSITLEYDNGSTKTDKYDRHLVWVFVDGRLLQEDLVSQGLAKVAYLYGDYEYTDRLKTAESEARAKQVNIWSSSDNELLNEVTDEGDDEDEIENEPVTSEAIAIEESFNLWNFIKSLNFFEICVLLGVALLALYLLGRLINYLVDNKIVSKRDITKTAKKIYKKASKK